MEKLLGIPYPNSMVVLCDCLANFVRTAITLACEQLALVKKTSRAISRYEYKNISALLRHSVGVSFSKKTYTIKACMFLHSTTPAINGDSLLSLQIGPEAYLKSSQECIQFNHM